MRLSKYLRPICFQVVFYERDIRQVKAGEKTELVYSTVTGIKPDLSGPQHVPEILEKSQESDEESDTSEDGDDDSESSGSESEEQKKFVNSARPRDESPSTKKVCTGSVSLEPFSIATWFLSPGKEKGAESRKGRKKEDESEEARKEKERKVSKS